MVLVGYSDSEGSDSDTAPPVAKQTTKPATKAAPSLLNPGTNKVKVNLSSLTSGAEERDTDHRPAKRQRTGGGLDINAFLPPPKQPTKPLNNEGSYAAKKAAGRGLGSGVNLKTGAEPAFTRSEASSNLDIDGEPKDIKDVIAELRRSRLPAGASPPVAKEASPTIAPEVKLVGNAIRFKPKSVARGPVKKKVVVAVAAPSLPAKAPTATSSPALQASTTQDAPLKVPSTKAKLSLFSIGGADTTPSNLREDTSAMDDDTDMADAPDEALEETPNHAYQAPIPTEPSTSAVNGLNLSQAEMRQLFGRKAGKGGMPDLDGIKMVTVNADDQYAANEAFRATGETVSHNPVRGIAPGKHSLKQLVNAAATQADALEEHFAQGKRNQREAGSKYGW